MKSLTAVLAAAAVAALVTLLSAPAEKVAAGPMPAATAAAMHACAARAWPYLDCVGTRFGNPHIRLVTTDRLSPDMPLTRGR
jgi:hypothetical protein